MIVSNVMHWENVTKVHTLSSAKHYSPPPLLKSMRCTKTISRSGIHSRPRSRISFGDDQRSAASGDENAGREYQKSLLTAHSVMEMCCSCFINTKIND